MAAELNWMLGVPPAGADGPPPVGAAGQNGSAAAAAAAANFEELWGDTFVAERCNGAVHCLPTDSSATIVAAGLSKPLKILHLSDSHIDAGREGVPSFGEPGFEYSMTFAIDLYGAGLPDRTTGALGRSAAETFAEQVVAAKAAGVDLVVHTGDLFNFPSPAAVELVMQTLRDNDMPHLFISGNHDW
eukprot:SAG22_NODE_545_length_9265_cov_7.988108_4_plen_187_part_00